MAADMEDIITKSCDIPTMPAAAGRVVQLVSDPNTTADMLSKAIMADQAMAARVLKVANSSFYYCLRTVSTLTQAIVIVGFDIIKDIVLAASLKNLYRSYGPTEKMLHEHSLGVAMATHLVAREAGFKNAEEAFLVGLLHDIGKAILNNNDPKRFRDVMDKVHTSGRTFADVESDEYGFTHSDVGALVIKKWNLTPEMEEAVRFHHSPGSIAEVVRSPNLKLASAVNLGDAICHKAGIGVGEPRETDLGSLFSAGVLGLNSERLARVENGLMESLEESAGLLD